MAKIPEKLGSEYYSSQRLERDAEKYGNLSFADYYEKIRAYLDSN